MVVFRIKIVIYVRKFMYDIHICTASIGGIIKYKCKTSLQCVIIS